MTSTAGSGRLAWLMQAFSGLGLVVLVGLHWVAQHYLARGGLRTYAEVAVYLSHPLIFALEVAFLVVVTAHAMLGVRALLLDLGLKERSMRALNLFLGLVGAGIVLYGTDLLRIITR